MAASRLSTRARHLCLCLFVLIGSLQAVVPDEDDCSELPCNAKPGQAFMQLLNQRIHEVHLGQETADTASKGADVSADVGRLAEMAGFAEQLAQRMASENRTTTESEKEAAEIVKTYFDRLKNATRLQHTEHQSAVAQARDLIAQCATDASKELEEVNAYKATMEGARTAHASCRTTEATGRDESALSCQAYDSARNGASLPDCACSTLTGANFRSASADVKMAMENCLEMTNAAITALHSQMTACHAAAGNHNNSTKTCGEMQSAFERDFCTYDLKLSDACKEQERCRNRTMANRLARHAEVREAEASRRSIWTAIEFASCYLDIVLGNSSGDEALTACQELRPGTDHLVITYYDVPPAHPCTPEASKPCSEEWEANEYDGQSWYTKAPTVSCTPCPVPLMMSGSSKAAKVTTTTTPPLPAGTKTCKDLYDAGITTDGVYALPVTGLDGVERPVELYCDMARGGWTLIGQVSGKHRIQNKWLREFNNAENLKSPTIEKGIWSCIDAIDMAVNGASHVKISSEDGTKYVFWPMSQDRDMSTWWNHAATQSVINRAADMQVNVQDQDGRHKTCYQNKYGVMPLRQHGGSYPVATNNAAGNTSPRDLCMAVGVQPSGSKDGFSQNGNGYDAPDADTDWMNSDYRSPPFVSVWLK